MLGKPSVFNKILITTKLENDLGQGHHSPKFYEDIFTFRVKARSLKSAVFLLATKLSGILHVFQ